MVKIITKRYRLQEEKKERHTVVQHKETPVTVEKKVNSNTKKRKTSVTAVATENNISENVKENE
jgi:hypothetical protein